jgi:hypothetical protein
MPRFDRVRALVTSGLVVALAAVVVASPAGDPGPSAGSQIRYAHLDLIADFEDDRQLVGAVENVFVGRVLAQLGTTILDEAPETQFTVEVLENVKGSLSGKVVVNQEGGQYGDVFVLMEDDALLKSGQTYLFATLPFKERGWHSLVARYGDLLITDAQHRASLVERFRKATQEQILYTPK